MFERFTERARQVVVLAQEESRRLHNDYISPSHILLGCIAENDGLAAQVLNHLNVSANDLRDLLKDHTPPSFEEATIGGGQIPFTSQAKKALELAMREALGMGHNYIGTEHVLLGVIREPGSTLENFLCGSIDDQWKENIRLEVIELLRGPLPKKDLDLNNTEKKELELKGILADLLTGYRMWKDVKMMNEEWTDEDESLARWIEGSKISEFL